MSNTDTKTFALSVVIPTYQRRASLERLLRALCQQTLAPDQFEVVVSIDGSSDGTCEMVEHFSAPFHLRSVWHANMGLAATLNEGIRAAASDLLVFLDDDMEPAPECLAEHLRSHASGERVAVMGAVPMVVEPDASPIVAYMNMKYEFYWRTWSQPGAVIPYSEFYNGNFSIRRELIVSVGLFDEQLFRHQVYVPEDTELAYRLAKAGVTFAFNPRALAHQHYIKDFRALARDTTSEGRGEVMMASVHPETFADTRLRLYTESSRPLQWARAALLHLSRVAPALPRLIVRLMSWIEQRRPRNLNYYYQLALGYFYWLGALAAVRENRRAGRGLIAIHPPAYAEARHR